MLIVTTWLWGERFTPDDVRKLRAGVARNLREPHLFVCFTDCRFEIDGVYAFPILDLGLTQIPGCFARLRLFDPEIQNLLFPVADPTNRIVNIDLDSIITGPLDCLFGGYQDFIILQGANLANPCPYNGALWMLRPGVHPEVWREFSPAVASTIAHHEFPDDQGWLWHKVPNAAGWPVGAASGVYVFNKRGWPPGDMLPAGARVVTFVRHSPDEFVRLPWVRKHWRV
jgi:hypothetical protein